MFTLVYSFQQSRTKKNYWRRKEFKTNKKTTKLIVWKWLSQKSQKLLVLEQRMLKIRGTQEQFFVARYYPASYISRARFAPANWLFLLLGWFFFDHSFTINCSSFFSIAFQIYLCRCTYLDRSPLYPLKWICAPKGFLGLYFQIILCSKSVPTRWRGKLPGELIRIFIWTA